MALHHLTGRDPPCSRCPSVNTIAECDNLVSCQESHKSVEWLLH